MYVKEQEYFHIHRKGCEDEKWKVGNVITIDKSLYNVFFSCYINHTIEKNDPSIPSDTKIKEYAIFIRELIYEEVRKEFYNELPSRKHCIWLCEKSELAFWKNTLNCNHEIYKVLATGNIHECYADALEDNLINYNLMRQKAHSYWQGQFVQNPLEKEFLFEGQIQVIEKL